MKNRILRLALVVLAVAGLAAAGFFVFQQEQAQSAARYRLVALSRDIGRVQSMIGEMRLAQAGMVGHGQDAGFWVPKVATLVQDATTRLAGVDRAALGTEAAQDLAAALEALALFGRSADTVRDLLATDQPLTASAIAFADAQQHLSTASGALASLAPTQALAVEREMAALRRTEAYALLSAAAFTLIVLLLLLPRGRQTERDAGELPAAGVGLGLALRPTPPPDVEAIGEAIGRTGFDLDIPRAGAVSAPDALPEQPRESEEEIVNDLQRESQLRLNTEARVDLAETARLCGDLACVKDGGELPGILARAADILDAAGVVLWIAEPGGAVLRPAASHGYSEHTMARMKALPVAAENAVSVAYRAGRMEVVRGSRERNGALVSPINAAGGCAGAMAVELRHGAEASPEVQAVAAIISAQLASLVAETTSA